MHTAPISSIAAHGAYMATSGYDNQVILWKAHQKEFIGRGLHDHLANKVVFSPDGQYLLSAGSDCTVRLWQVPEMRLRIVFDGHEDDVEDVAFSNSGALIATACRDKKVRIYDLQGRLLHTLTGHTADALSVAWSENDEQLISSGDDGTLRVWEVAAGREVGRFSFEEVETDTCAISRGFVYAGNDLGEIIILKLETGTITQTLKAHHAGIKSIVVQEEHGLLLSCSYDKTIILWRVDAGNGSLIQERKIAGHPLLWLRAAAIADKNTLAFGTFGACYATYDLNRSEWDFSRVENTHGKNAVLSVAGQTFSVGDAGVVFKADAVHSLPGSLCNFLVGVQDQVYTGGQTGQLFDAATGQVVHEHHSPLNCGTMFRKGGQTFLVVGSYTGEGLLFESRAGQLHFLRNLKLHSNAIKGISANSKHLFSVSANREAAFYDLETLQLLKCIPQGHTLIANGCDFLDEHRFASISRDRVLRIWENLELVREVATPHTHSIKCIKAASTKRHLIATGGYGGLFCLYNLQTEKWLLSRRLSSAGISSLSYDETTDHFLASSYDGKVYRVPV